MEKQSFSSLVTHFRTSFRNVRDGSMNSDFMWRLFLSLMLSAVCAVLLSGYLTYLWATSNDGVSVPKVTSRDTQTISDLKSMISLYQGKDRAYSSLLKTPPVAPDFAHGKGVSVSNSSGIEEDVLPPEEIPTSEIETPSLRGAPVILN